MPLKTRSVTEHSGMSGVSHYRKCDTQCDIVTGLCHRFGMCHGVCASDVTGLACGASDVTGLACVMASVRQCHGVCVSDVMSRNVKTASPLTETCCFELCAVFLNA